MGRLPLQIINAVLVSCVPSCEAAEIMSWHVLAAAFLPHASRMKANAPPGDGASAWPRDRRGANRMGHG